MKKITVILPVHKINDEYKVMLDNALKSTETFHDDVKVLIVHPAHLYDDMMKSIKEINNVEIKCLAHTSPSDFCTQVNKGIEICDTEWFTILEVDDEFKPIWLKSMTDYINEYPEVSVFLPVVKDVNVEGKFVSFTNEANWAYGFTEKQGFVDNEVLLEFQNYQTSGALYKTEVIKTNGSFKDNIKITFSYEFLLRLTHNNVQVMTVPRIGYQHVNFREDSLFWKYKNDIDMKISEEEVKFWLETARKEYFYTNKRDINYVTS